MTAETMPLEFIQGTPEWLAFRKTKITATDACIIMGVSPWKTRRQLYDEKTAEILPDFYMSDAMRRGLELEPIARSLYSIQAGVCVEPRVIVNDWSMASLDGISDCGKFLVEIKCPGEKDHTLALAGKVPDHYYPQLQHQMYVCNVQLMHYYSFDGTDGVIVEVLRDDKYIEKMIAEEYKFYMCLIEKTPPEPEANDYIQRDDALWTQCAEKWKSTTQQIKELQAIEEDLRKQLIFLSGESNTKGAGISLCQVLRKGNIDYSKIPELKNVDLDKYRKSQISSWRIS